MPADREWTILKGIDMTLSATRRVTAALFAAGIAVSALSGCQALNTLSGGGDQTRDPGTSENTGGGNAGSEGTEKSIFDIRVGDCFSLPEDKEGEVKDAVVYDSCDDPHTYEAFATTDMPQSKYPGDQETQEWAENACMDEFKKNVKNPDDFTFSYYFPTRESWSEGDREVLCVAAKENGSDWTGSAVK